MSQSTSGASVLAECLYQHGARRIFGMPGSHSTHIYDALRERGLQTTLCRNEQAGAFMADGYARVTGQPGVICTTAGPGATHALSGMAEAFSDSVPVLLLAGQVRHDRLHESCGLYHEIDLEAIFRPCVRYAATVLHNDDISAHVDRAFAAMVHGRPGPAALFLPHDLMAQPARPAAATAGTAVNRVSAPDSLVRQATALIRAHAHPIIVAGGGAVSSQAGAAIELIAERLGCPVVTTLNGKGLLDERHHAAFGHGRTRRARAALARADLLVAIGCRFTEVFTAASSMPVPSVIIQIDVDPAQLGMNYPVSVGLEGDARTTLEAMLDDLPAGTADWSATWWRLRQAPQLKREWLIDTLRAAIPDETVVVADACEMGLRMHTDFPAYAPRTFLYPSNYACLGWGFPAAIGAAQARQEQGWTACVVGDGGFTMSLQELATAARYALRLITVVHNDSAYGAIKALQRARHDARYVDTDLNNPDFVALGHAFDVPSCRVATAADLAAAVAAALRRDGPSLIEVRDEWRPIRL